MNRLTRILWIVAFIALGSGAAVSQELVCPGTPVPDEECTEWHYHVEIWLPDLNSFQRIYAFAPLATAVECQEVRDAAETQNHELISRLQTADPERSFQSNRFGPCHCDRTSDRSNAYYLSDAQRRAQMRVASTTEETLHSMDTTPQVLIATAEGEESAEPAADSSGEERAALEARPADGGITQEDLLAPPPVAAAVDETVETGGNATPPLTNDGLPTHVPAGLPAVGGDHQEPLPTQDAPVPIPQEAETGYDGPAAPLPPPLAEPTAPEPPAAPQTEAVVDNIFEVIPAPPAPSATPSPAEPETPLPAPAPPVPASDTVTPTLPPAVATTPPTVASRPVVVPVPPTPAQAASGVSRTDKVVLREGSPDAPRIEIKWSKEREATPPEPSAATTPPAPGAVVPPVPGETVTGENPFLSYETSRVQEIIKASSAVTDGATKAQVFEASMQRLQVLENLRRLEEAGGATTLTPMMHEARDEASRLRFVGRLFGEEVRRHWAPTDARGVIVTVPPEIDADPSGALSQSSGLGPNQRGLALYVVLARSSEMSADQESGILSMIDAQLRRP